MKKNNISPEYPDFWNQKYINNDAQWDIGSPTPIFIDWSKTLLSRKKILIPGAGRGHDALYLGQKNHDVYAVLDNKIYQWIIDELNLTKKTTPTPGP